MSNKTGFFEEAVESGTTLVKQTGKATGKAVTDTAKAAVSQTGVPAGSTSDEDFVKDLYEVGKKTTQAAGDSNQNSQTPPAQAQSDPSAQKPPEDQKQMQAVRAKLHQERHNKVYYNPLVNPKGDQPEERPAEKVENEKQEDMMELQKKEKEKPPPLAVRQGQKRVESPVGSG